MPLINRSALRRLAQRARTTAHEHIPRDMIEKGQNLSRRVLDRTPDAVQNLVGAAVSEIDEFSRAEDRQGDIPSDSDPQTKQRGSNEESANTRTSDTKLASSTSDEEPKENPAGYDDTPEEHVVIYTTLEEQDSATRIREIFAKHKTVARLVDLAAKPHIKRQMGEQTGVFSPPYVYIGGRYWGAEDSIRALDITGDLFKIVEFRYDELSDEAKRLGKIREYFDDALTAENIIERLKLGHILCIDELDTWYETPDDRLFHQGQAFPGAQLIAIADEIESAVEENEMDAQWRFEPQVTV